MKTREEMVWKSLLAQSAPTFAGEFTPPLGLATRVLAAARESQLQESAWERTGLKAILASLTAVMVLGVVTFATHRHRHEDPEGSVRSLAALEDLQVS